MVVTLHQVFIYLNITRSRSNFNPHYLRVRQERLEKARGRLYIFIGVIFHQVKTDLHSFQSNPVQVLLCVIVLLDAGIVIAQILLDLNSVKGNLRCSCHPVICTPRTADQILIEIGR